MQSSFLCTRVSGHHCNLCVCHYMWSEFYHASWLGRLDQFLECFTVFSHPPLPLIIIILLLLSLLLFLLVITVIIISTELLALCDGCCTGLGMVGGARGWVASRAGFWGALATWVWGQQLQPPSSWAPNLHMRCRC